MILIFIRRHLLILFHIWHNFMKTEMSLRTIRIITEAIATAALDEPTSPWFGLKIWIFASNYRNRMSWKLWESLLRHLLMSIGSLVSVHIVYHRYTSNSDTGGGHYHHSKSEYHHCWALCSLSHYRCIPPHHVFDSERIEFCLHIERVPFW